MPAQTLHKDALGKPLFDNGSWDNIDPTVWMDEDGQAYLELFSYLPIE